VATLWRFESSSRHQIHSLFVAFPAFHSPRFIACCLTQQRENRFATKTAARCAPVTPVAARPKNTEVLESGVIRAGVCGGLGELVDMRADELPPEV
jgi:hypothetical protein